MIRSLLLLLVLLNISFRLLSQSTELPPQLLDGRITMQSASIQSNLFPVLRADYRVLFNRIGFNAAIETFNKTSSASQMFLYDADFSSLPTSISDTSINYNFNTWENKSFEVQLGVGSGTERFMFVDDTDLPTWLVRFGGELSFGRNFAHQLHGNGYYKISVDSITNETQFYNSSNEPVEYQEDAAKLISNFELSKFITHQFGAQVFGSIEYFILGSRLSIGLRVAGGISYAWLYQYHGELDESLVNTKSHEGISPKLGVFGCLSWSF